MDLIETVARAIGAKVGDYSEGAGWLGDDTHAMGLERAKAAIEAYQKALWPPMDFNTRALTIDLRRRRADSITAHIMHAIGKYLCRHGEADGAREVSRSLFQMLYEAGADIVTDVDRANIGLAPRDHGGLTRDELHIMENRRIEAMLRPMPPLVMTLPQS